MTCKGSDAETFLDQRVKDSETAFKFTLSNKNRRFFNHRLILLNTALFFNAFVAPKQKLADNLLEPISKKLSAHGCVGTGKATLQSPPSKCHLQTLIHEEGCFLFLKLTLPMLNAFAIAH
jgi:hypothetical protein